MPKRPPSPPLHQGSRLGNTYTLDIHELSASEAQHLLERLLVSLPDDIREVVVIHGHRRGDALTDTVRRRVRSRRIKRIFLSLNPGVTHYIL